MTSRPDDPGNLSAIQGIPPGDPSFPRGLRLTRPSDFERVLKQGWRWTTAHLVVHLLAHDGPDSRLGLTVSRKIGGAPERNRVKRRLREGFRRTVRSALGSRGVDVVLRARVGAASAPQSVLLDEVLVAVLAWREGRRGGRGGRGRTEMSS